MKSLIKIQTFVFFLSLQLVLRVNKTHQKALKKIREQKKIRDLRERENKNNRRIDINEKDKKTNTKNKLQNY